jgi:hypothetical protein
VDKAGRGYIYIARLVQPNLKFEMDRYPFERYGTYYTLNDGGYEGRAFGRRVHETLAVLDKTNRNLEHGIRVEHGQACRNRLAALAVPVLAILAGGVGWALRDAGNRRVKDRTGVSADDTLAKGQAHAKEVGEAKAKDATEPPAVSKRLAEARAKGDETELRDLYATLRKTLRKKEHLPVVAATIRQSPFVSKQSLEVAKFEEKLKTFLEDNDAADAILDQALAEATKGAAADVQGIKDLLFGDDKTKAAFREKTYALLYPSVVKTLWPGVVPDTAPFSIDDPLAAMRKDAQADIEAISGRYRARPAPVVKPTEIGRNP